MTGRILSYWVRRVINRIRFPGQVEGGRAISDSVLTVFGRGATLGLRGGGMDACRLESLSLPWNVRAFFNEGHAMGSAGRQACSLRRRNPETHAPGEYEIMRYVGYGFWNGVAMTYPVPSVPKNGSYWNGVDSFTKYRLLMGNGCGFSMVLFRGQLTGEVKEAVLREKDHHWQEATLHGIGRVLWFLYLNNYNALNRILDDHREIAEPLALGLGLAIAFTQVGAPGDIVRSLDAFPDAHRVHLIRGAGIGFQVHAQNDTECRRRVERLLPGELSDWYEGARIASRDAGDGREWYPLYHELTKRFSTVAAARDLRHV